MVVTTHLYDGKKSLPLDIELYHHAKSLPEGKKDPKFKKKPAIALDLITRKNQRKNSLESEAERAEHKSRRRASRRPVNSNRRK